MSTPQRVHVDRLRAQAGNAVHNQQRRRIFHQRGHAFHIVAGAGRGLGGLHIDGLVLGLERRLHLGQVKSFTVGLLDHIHLQAEGLGQIHPALAEFARRQHQHAVARRGQIRDRSLHRARPGAREQQHIVLRADKDLQLRQNFGEQRAELRCAMMNVGRRHGKLGSGKQGRRTGRKQAGFADHGSLLRFLSDSAGEADASQSSSQAGQVRHNLEADQPPSGLPIIT